VNLARVPGPFDVRVRLAHGFISPTYTWAVPLMAPAPEHHADLLRRALLRTSCTWWCKGRFWCQHVSTHPQMGAALLAFKHRSPPLPASSHLETGFQRHAKSLGLKWIRTEPNGIQILATTLPEDQRILDAITTANEKCPGNFPLGGFAVDDDSGLHCLRLIARYRLLMRANWKGNQRRNDTEQIQDVDLEASSAPPWKKLFKHLSSKDRFFLRVFRSGAISTPTRRYNCRNYALGDESQTLCQHCGVPRCSARHLIVECPFFQVNRDAINDRLNLRSDWLTFLPRVTTKSGWITLAAHETLYHRSLLQVAVCQLAIDVLHASGL
jgi:hypothetical protein